jgi:hypothetical protein
VTVKNAQQSNYCIVLVVGEPGLRVVVSMRKCNAQHAVPPQVGGGGSSRARWRARSAETLCDQSLPSPALETGSAASSRGNYEWTLPRESWLPLWATFCARRYQTPTKTAKSRFYIHVFKKFNAVSSASPLSHNEKGVEQVSPPTEPLRGCGQLP